MENPIFLETATRISWLCSASLVPCSWIRKAAESENQFYELMAEREQIIEELFEKTLELKRMEQAHTIVSLEFMENYGTELVRNAAIFHDKMRILVEQNLRGQA